MAKIEYELFKCVVWLSTFCIVAFVYKFIQCLIWPKNGMCTVFSNLMCGEVGNDVRPFWKGLPGTLQVVEIALGHRF